MPYRDLIGLKHEKRGGTPDGRASKVRANSSAAARPSNAGRNAGYGVLAAGSMDQTPKTALKPGATREAYPVGHLERKSRRGQKHG